MRGMMAGSERGALRGVSGPRLDLLSFPGELWRLRFVSACAIVN